jgi:hypothetical protein
MRRIGQLTKDDALVHQVATRFAGGTLMAAAAWRRSAPGIAAGAAVIAISWSHGLLPPALNEHPAALIPTRRCGPPAGVLA